MMKKKVVAHKIDQRNAQNNPAINPIGVFSGITLRNATDGSGGHALVQDAHKGPTTMQAGRRKHRRPG
jgi:hypothetical protein